MANDPQQPFALPAVPFGPPILGTAVRNITVHVVDEQNILTQQQAYLQEQTANPSQAYIKWPMKKPLILNAGRGEIVYCQVLLRDWTSANTIVFRPSDFYVAIKKIRRHELDQALHREATGLGTIVNENAYTEIKVMQEYGNNENVLPCYEALWDARYLYIVMLYAREGDLFSHVHPGLGGGFPSRAQIPALFKQLVSNLQYLQHHGLIHRDLKPENVVLKANWVPLIDFAMTVQCAVLEGQAVHVLSRGPAGSPSYISPEIFNRQPFDFAVDVWALGAILWNLLTGLRLYELPFDASFLFFIREHGLSDEHLCNTVLEELLDNHGNNNDLLPRLQAIQILSQEERTFLAWLMQENPMNRPSLQEILQHPYLQ